MDAPPGSPAGDRPGRRSRWHRLVLLLLVVPFVGTLWVSSYSSLAPELGGVPFFYWYQFLWIAISAALTILVYALEGRRPARTAVTGEPAERGRPAS